MTERTRGGAPGVLAFPAQLAATRRFTLGAPRAFADAQGGSSILFLRSASGRDPTTSLWSVDLATGEERRIADASTLVEGEQVLSDAERSRRERSRELAEGITAFDVDARGVVAVFGLNGRLYSVLVDSATIVEHPLEGLAFDPRISPDAKLVSYIAGGSLHIRVLSEAGDGRDWILAGTEGDATVRWGVAEFVAAEEMGRSRGSWWSPDSTHIALTRVDESQVAMWHLADPASPWTPPPMHRYPAAGTANADVALFIGSPTEGTLVPVTWDRASYPYLNRVAWDRGPSGAQRLTIQVQSRDQCRVQILTVDEANGAVRLVRQVEQRFPIELVAGSPAWQGNDLVTVEDAELAPGTSARSLLVNGRPITGHDLQVRSIVGVSASHITFVASGADSCSTGVFRCTAEGHLTPLSPASRGIAAGTACAGTVVISWSTLNSSLTRYWALKPDGAELELSSMQEEPTVRPVPTVLRLARRDLASALLVPAWHDGGQPLPVVLDPYGGPHAQRVVASSKAYLTSQWLADQGFAVLVIDGRGTPGRGPAWEQAVHGSLAEPVLEDQLDGLDAAASRYGFLDTGRVAIRGWSFGGFLAAVAAVRAPDRIHAAVVGAPVTNWRWYDTHYTERYLGEPESSPDAYVRSSVVDDAGRLVGLRRSERLPEVLIIQGLADDNVVAAHALALSAALTREGWLHRFLPLPGVTHFTAEADLTTRLLELEVGFLKSALLAS